MNEQIAEALKYDPIADAERILGVSYKEDDSAVWLGMALMHKQREVTDGLLLLNDDTNVYTQSWKEWCAVVERLGFELVLEDNVPDTKDVLRIYWKSGILLCCDSYYGRRCNSAHAYLNYRGSYDSIHTAGGGSLCCIEPDSEPPLWELSKDAREGFRFFLESLQAGGTIEPKWTKRPFLWLLHYNDTKVEGYDSKAITAERISRLPQHIQEAITP